VRESPRISERRERLVSGPRHPVTCQTSAARVSKSLQDSLARTYMASGAADLLPPNLTRAAQAAGSVVRRDVHSVCSAALLVTRTAKPMGSPRREPCSPRASRYPRRPGEAELLLLYGVPMPPAIVRTAAGPSAAASKSDLSIATSSARLFSQAGRGSVQAPR
jgi:hypothetical protein